MTNAFNLSQLANNTNSSGQVTLTTGVAGTLPVANGGTGAATLTANNLLVGAGTGAVTGIAAGTSGNVLTSNGTTWASTAAAGGGFANMVAYVAPGTWTLPPGVTKVKVTVVGAGAAGSAFPGGNGGGGGGTSVKYMDVTGPVAYAAGAGTNSFGPTPSGTVSATAGSGITGGVGSGGTLSIKGGDGGQRALQSPSVTAEGTGGSSSIGGGGAGYLGPASSGSGSPGGNYGGGGGGSATGGSTTGAPGVVIIEY
jgi:hypothetical protein